MSIAADTLQNGANILHSWGFATPEWGLTEGTGGTSANQQVTYKLSDGGSWTSPKGALNGMETINGKVYNFGVGSSSGTLVRDPSKDPKPPTDTGGFDGTLDLTGSTAADAAAARATANQTGAERAAYDDQINNINQLLGLVDTQSQGGLARLDQSLADQKTRLGEQETKTMAGYDTQDTENRRDKQRGIEGVDQFANNSFTSLQRLLQGSNAGNSSVARELMPYLVSKSAGARRTGVFDQAGKNEQNIATARGGAKDEYGYARQDAENQANSQRETFRTNIANKQSELIGNRKTLEMQRAAANGEGYAGVQAATANSNAQLAGNRNTLASLFDQFKPTYTQRAMNLTKPELGQFTVDKAQINNNQGLPAESSYYQTMLNKKKQEQQG